VTNKLPAGIPVTLRVFGNQPDSCDTNMVVPLGPLDPITMSQTIQGIEPVNLVRTPIGASLQQVANDLAGASGPKVVILVTDGEETCDGDPAKAIRDLKAQGFDVQINIVGFALDDDALRAQFADWAQLGGGAYYDATNATELSQAIAKVAQAPFKVLDSAGNVVATGTVGGDPIDLPPGTYTVDVLTDPEQTIDQVVVEEDKPTGAVDRYLAPPPDFINGYQTNTGCSLPGHTSGRSFEKCGYVRGIGGRRVGSACAIAASCDRFASLPSTEWAPDYQRSNQCDYRANTVPPAPCIGLNHAVAKDRDVFRDSLKICESGAPASVHPIDCIPSDCVNCPPTDAG